MYNNAEVTPQDYTEEMKWARKAADQGLAKAELLLATAYLRGLGVDKDPVAGMTWLRKAADQGDSLAMGLVKNAIASFSQPAEQSDATAKEILGILTEPKPAFPDGSTTTLEDLHAKAEAGNSTAQVLLAVRYGIGSGVPQNFGESLKWIVKAAEQGESDASDVVADMYVLDLPGIPEDAIEGWKWRRKAADQGSARSIGAIYDVIPMYRHQAEQGGAEAKAILDILTKSPLPPAPAVAPITPSTPATGATKGNPQAELKTAITDIARLMKAGEGAKMTKTYMPPPMLKQMPPSALSDLRLSMLQTDQKMGFQVRDTLKELLELFNARAFAAMADQTPTYNAAGDEATYTLIWPMEGGEKTQPVIFVKINGLWYFKTVKNTNPDTEKETPYFNF